MTQAPMATAAITTAAMAHLRPALAPVPELIALGRAKNHTTTLNGQSNSATRTATMKPGWPRRSASRQTHATLPAHAASNTTPSTTSKSSGSIPIPEPEYVVICTYRLRRTFNDPSQPSEAEQPEGYRISDGQGTTLSLPV